MTYSSHISPSSYLSIKGREHRRRRAAKLFQKGYSQAEVARHFGVSRESARNWYDTWKEAGTKGLASKPKTGRPSKLTESKKKMVKQALLAGPRSFGYHTDIWTLERVATAIQKVAGVSYHHRHVWRILLSMGWSCQKPETRARERNEKAIKYWREVTWPRIQKKG